MLKEIEEKKKVLEEEFENLKKKAVQIEKQVQTLQNEHLQTKERMVQLQGGYQALNSLNGEGNKPRMKQNLDHLPKKKR